MIRDLTTDKTKRNKFDRLHQHLNQLADEVDWVIASNKMEALGRISSRPPSSCANPYVAYWRNAPERLHSQNAVNSQ
ncbi:hypothetical protein I6F35_09455 [Bradyrhizobium sp. BRP22]|uniref:hypothetical protein n=1 Tax=Bradyrhizobium sp. BRP22 TaxID=2793821 RepID=UPI001CD2EDD6|nr:hypothetical protein [Bradyrhizobium sp. BRP22]MCA1453439.1 hypothetical protein [Bradyrhizobium sp. BRP22]